MRQVGGVGGGPYKGKDAGSCGNQEELRWQLKRLKGWLEQVGGVEGVGLRDA